MFGGSRNTCRRKTCRRKSCRRKTLRGGNPIMGGPSGRSGGSDFSKGSSGSFKFGGRKRTCKGGEADPTNNGHGYDNSWQNAPQS
jgi:hypothetical protein